MLHQTGVIKTAQFNAVIEIYSVAMATKWLFLNRNFVVAWLCKTRQHSDRKEDRAMRPIYGCPEKF